MYILSTLGVYTVQSIIFKHLHQMYSQIKLNPRK